MAATCVPAKSKKKTAKKKKTVAKKKGKPEKGTGKDAKGAKGAKDKKGVKKEPAKGAKSKKKETKKKTCDPKKSGPRTAKAKPKAQDFQARMTASPGEPTYRLPGYAPRQQQTPMDRAILRLQRRPTVPSAVTARRRSPMAGLGSA
jgi:hypothetical protein